MKMRVLIVDDEMLVRISFKTLIPWEEHGFEIIGEASNGVMALEILSQQTCDLVLTNIRMPEMDRLEMINHIRVRWPKIKYIILSNHNEFLYVQKALRLEALDSILKLAWTPQELLDKCLHIQQSFFAEERANTEMEHQSFKLEQLTRQSREMLLRDLLDKQGTRVEIDFRVREHTIPAFLRDGYSVVVASVDNRRQVLEENRFKSEQLLMYTVVNIVSEILKKYGSSELVDMHHCKLAILTDAYMNDMLNDIRSAVETFASVSLSFGISQRCKDVHSLYQGFQQADHALKRRFFHDKSRMFFADEASTWLPHSEKLLQIEKWQRLFASADPASVLAEMEVWEEELREEEALGPQWVREQWHQWLQVLYRKLEEAGHGPYTLPDYEGKFPLDVIRNSETLREICVWFSGWLPDVLQSGHWPAVPNYREEIQEVIRILQEEYASPLKISELAKRQGFGENYLGVLFKKETGVKLVDYISQIRMEKARELLLNPSLKIYEISELVGYTDSNHFSKYFKKIEGIFPLEYRKLMTGRS